METDQQQSGIFGWLNVHPMLALAIGVVGAFALVGLLGKKNAPATTTPSGDLSGLQTDANGNKIVYRDVADYFFNESVITNSNNTTTTNVTGAPTPPIYHPGPVPGTPNPTPTPQPKPAPAPTGNNKGQWLCHYSVVSGDTLSAIAARFGTSTSEMYSHNKGVIDSTSQAHGNPIPGGAINNIFPGEVLTVPCK